MSLTTIQEKFYAHRRKLTSGVLVICKSLRDRVKYMKIRLDKEQANINIICLQITNDNAIHFIYIVNYMASITKSLTIDTNLENKKSWK